MKRIFAVAIALACLSAPADIIVKEEGVKVGVGRDIDCVGSNLTCSVTGGVAKITVGASGASLLPGAACSAGQALFWNGSAYSCADSWVNTTGDTMTGTLTMNTAATAISMASNQAVKWNGTTSITSNGTSQITMNASSGVFTGSNGFNANGGTIQFYTHGLIAYSGSSRVDLVQTQSGITNTLRSNTTAGQTGWVIGSSQSNTACDGTCYPLKIQDGVGGVVADLFTFDGTGQVYAANNYKFSDATVQTTAVPNPADDSVPLGNGTVWQNGALPSCTGANAALRYSQGSNTFTCNTAIQAATANSLLVNPADCSGDNFANAIDASGNLTCLPWTHLLWGDKHSDVYATDTVAHGAMIYYASAGDPPLNQSMFRLVYRPSPDSNDAVMMSPGSSTAPRWQAVPNCHNPGSALNYDTATDGWTCNTSIDAATAGTAATATSATSATTATQLAANGANCAAGQAAGGVSQTGAAESCVNVLDAAGSAYASGNNAANTISTSAFTTLLSASFTQTVVNQPIHIYGCTSFYVSAANVASSVRVTYNGVAQTAFQSYNFNANDMVHFCRDWKFTGAAATGTYTVTIQINKPTNYVSGAANAAGNVITNADTNSTLYME